MLLQPAPHPGPQPAALRQRHRRRGSVGLGWRGSRSGPALGEGADAPLLCHQRTYLTTTSTWTSAGKRSPITCAASPCMGAAPRTQNAAARTARPGASSVPCAPPGALVRGAASACVEGGEPPAERGWAPGRGCPHLRRGHLGKSRAVRVVALSVVPIVWG